MSILERFPQWYVDGKTYVAIDWDFHNFDEIMNWLKNKPEEVKFKWEDYHQEQLAEHQFDDEDDDWDDWNEEDEEGVEFIYKP